MPKRMPIVRAMLILVGIAAVLLTATLLWLKAHEDELVFHVAESRARATTTLPSGFERIAIPTESGALLAANILRAAPTHDSKLWILHLHGNTESAFSTTQYAHVRVLQRLGFSVLGIDYRGFGLTPGSPSENAIYQDAEAAYRYLKRIGVDDALIVLWGHSLGSGPAVYLAHEHPARALVLFGAFTSIPDAAADAYPYLPIKKIAGIHFDNRKRIGELNMPVLIAHSFEDRVIPYHHASDLYAAAKNPKQLLSLKPTRDDGLGGHQSALYDHANTLAASLTELLGIPVSNQ